MPELVQGERGFEVHVYSFFSLLIVIKGIFKT